MFTGPRSWRDSIEDPVGQDPAIYPQAELQPAHLQAFAEGLGGKGVVSGCLVTQASPTGMKLDIASGTGAIAGASIIVPAQQDIVVPTSHSTQGRHDLVVFDDSGTVSVIAGTPSVSSPVMPLCPDDNATLASLYIPHGLSTVLAAHITDMRVPVPLPGTGAGWNKLTAAANRSRSNTATLVTDTDLHFPLIAGGVYNFRCRMEFDILPASDFKYGLTGPASPARLSVFVHTYRIDAAAPNTIVSSVDRYLEAYDATGFVIAHASATGSSRVVVEMEGIIENGSNTSPDFGPTWAQNVGVVENTVRRIGSWIEFEEV